jgi:transglutaminase-like putative cysteine protease
VSEVSVKQTAKHRRIGSGMPLDFSRLTPIDKTWRWMSSGCLALSVIPVAFTLPLGWIFAVRIAIVCLLGAWRPHILPVRIGVLGADLAILLWWMFGGYPQAPTEVALAVFMLGVSFKAMELRHVGDGYMASVMCFLAPFLAIIQSLPWWAVVGSSFSIAAALMLRSGLACIESGTAAGKPWDVRHWRPTVGLMLMTLPLAIVTFWLIPRFSSPFMGGQRMGTTGMSDTMEPGSMDGMFQDPSQAMVVSFKGAAPDKNQMYWRAATLSVFDGRVWSPLPLGPAGETRPIRTPQTKVISYEVTVSPQPSNFVPFLDRVLSTGGAPVVDTYTLTHVSATTPTKARTYTAVSSPNIPWELDGLSDQARRGNLLLPQGFNPKTLALVKKWEEEGYKDQEMVDHALDYFGSHMTYSYTPPLLGRDSVDELLFDTREGFCEHFSSSFTFMMRAAGIPARVVTGYHAGRPTKDEKWQVQQFNAHAWSEVWIAGKGWVRVDPTFAVVRTLPPPPGREKSQGFVFPLVEWASDKSSDWFGEFNSQRQQDLFSSWKIENWFHWTLATGGLIIVLAWALSAFWWDWGGQRPAAEVVQFEKLRMVLLAKAKLGVSATPRQMLRATERLLPPSEHSQLALVLQDWERWRYANEARDDLVMRLKKARRSLRRSLKPQE